MKLKTKIQLFASLFMLILLLLVNTSIYFLFYNITADSELEELTNQTNSIVERLNETSDIPKKELLKAYVPANGMIRIIQEDETLILPTLTREEQFSDIPARYSQSEEHFIADRGGQQNLATVYKPIIWQNGEVVTLEVSRQLTALSENMTTLFYVLVAATLLMLIPTYIAGVTLGRFLLKPIQTLTAAMQTNSRANEWEKITVNNRSKDELYEMEATFNQMIDRLKDNFDRQEMFVSNASHELKTPISIITSYASMIRRRGYDDKALVVESIDAIHSEAERMQKLVEQMLELAKIKESLIRDNFDMTALVHETVDTFKKAYNRTIWFEQSNRSIQITGDRDQLQQVLYILIDNALKYSEDKVEVYIHDISTDIAIEVTDFGPGISEDAQPYVFSRFYRVDKSRSRETGGTGLGLAIAHNIVRAHQGELTLNSIAGYGTTVTLKLPKA